MGKPLGPFGEWIVTITTTPSDRVIACFVNSISEIFYRFCGQGWFFAHRWLKKTFSWLQEIFSHDYKRLPGTNISFNMWALIAKHDLDFNTGLLYGIFSAGTCNCSTRRIQRIVQVGKKILKQFRSGDENCSTNANKQMRGRPRQNLQICFWHSHKERTGYVIYSFWHTF